MNRLTPNTVNALLILAVVAFAANGCSSNIRTFTHPEADMNYYTSVGVVPFTSLTGDRFAGEKFGLEFTTALLAANLFEVKDYGIFANAVTKTLGSRSPSQDLSLENLQKLKDLAGVQGVFLGSVKQYEMDSGSGGTFPVISVEVRLLDVETGTVVWMATATRKGGPNMPVLGVGEIHTLGALAQKMSKELVSKLK